MLPALPDNVNKRADKHCLEDNTERSESNPGRSLGIINEKERAVWKTVPIHIKPPPVPLGGRKVRRWLLGILTDNPQQKKSPSREGLGRA